MKKLLFFILSLVTWGYAFSQDVIVKKDGSTVLCKVVQANNKEVIYLKWSDLNGPQYIMDSSLVSTINYQDGRQDKINEQISNNYAPSIQQTGEAQYNDNALLALDRTRNMKIPPLLKKSKNFKIIGLTVGPACIIGGVVLMVLGNEYGLDNDGGPVFICGTVLLAGGVATSTICLIKANQYQKQYHNLSFTPLIQKDFNFTDSHSITASVDFIHDKRTNKFLPGVGLQFNF